MGKKILYLINHNNDSYEMGQNGYQVLQENYNQELFYEKLVKMYKDVLTKSP